ncbi:MAG: substrate-binding domain-containing protein [bacterium]
MSPAAKSILHGQCDSDRLRADIVDAIQQGRLRPGDRLPSIRDLAREYNLAFGTAQRILAALERGGHVERRNRSGVYVRQAANADSHGDHATSRSTITGHVALLMNPEAHYFSELVASIVRELQPHGLRCVPWAPPAQCDVASVDQLRPMLDSWRDDPPCAVVDSTGIAGLEQEVNRILPASTRRIRAVRHDDNLTTGWHCVGADRRRALELALDHLLERGHERIGLALSARRIATAHYDHMRKAEHARLILMLGELLRQRGKKRALTLFTTRPDAASQHKDPQKSTDSFAAHNIERAAAWLSGPDRPTAVIGATDYHAAAIRVAANRAGLRVPEDLELVGAYNTPWSHAHNFSTVDHRPGEIGQHIARLVVTDASELGSSSRRICVEPKLVVRGCRSETALLPSLGGVAV